MSGQCLGQSAWSVNQLLEGQAKCEELLRSRLKNR